jgi:hypothetical protein
LFFKVGPKQTAQWPTSPWPTRPDPPSTSSVAPRHPRWTRAAAGHLDPHARPDLFLSTYMNSTSSFSSFFSPSRKHSVAATMPLQQIRQRQAAPLSLVHHQATGCVLAPSCSSHSPLSPSYPKPDVFSPLSPSYPKPVVFNVFPTAVNRATAGVCHRSANSSGPLVHLSLHRWATVRGEHHVPLPFRKQRPERPCSMPPPLLRPPHHRQLGSDPLRPSLFYPDL